MKLTKEQIEDRIDKVVEWTTRNYLVTGKDATVKEITAGTGLGEGIVRRVLDATMNRSLQGRTEYRTTFSRDYPAFPHGTKATTVWGPTRSALRGIINEKN